MTTNDFQFAYGYCKFALSLMSDNTFLSSIEYISFRDKVIQVKSGYWKTLIVIIKKNNLQITNFGSLCCQFKKLFIERFSVISANKIKSFLLGKLHSSFYDFKNILYYGDSVFKNNGLRRKNISRLRLHRYFENKAYKFYLRYINSVKNIINEELDHSEDYNYSDDDQNYDESDMDEDRYDDLQERQEQFDQELDNTYHNAMEPLSNIEQYNNMVLSNEDIEELIADDNQRYVRREPIIDFEIPSYGERERYVYENINPLESVEIGRSYIDENDRLHTEVIEGSSTSYKPGMTFD